MTVRKAIFWTHLGAGVIAALVIVMMCVTGVVLTYERQMKEWADRQVLDISEGRGNPLTVDELLAAARAADPELRINTIGVHSRPDMPPVASQGRRGQVYLDPHSGDLLGPGNTELRQFFSTIRGWHRWFDLTGDPRATGRAITGAANLMFLFLVVSGIYLWLPPLWRWVIVRQRMLFNDRANNAKARDYNWHHVFGFWIFVPLFLIVLSATPISYPWARNTVYVLSGEPVPNRGGAGERADPPRLPADTRVQSMQSFFEKSLAHTDSWRRIDIQVPSHSATMVDVTVDEGTGGEPHKKRTLTFDRVSGDIVATSTFDDRTTAGKILSYFRWVHTGEAHGLIGQTIAGIVSALAVLMAWTGVALAWRRLISPILRRRRLARP
jgi:uncharacterized iron-regulated membrane protein